ncbi:hypothetical protein ccbrp13_66700 [Ktedonobacteria bacterium brp13]|nr:hypothetical protein ccbrp13_66700 [Ktedonobacteria bacterium brp13]
MQDKTFAQAMDELNHEAQEKVTTEVIHCWIAIQQGSTIANATTYLSNEHMEQTVTHVLSYMLLQSALYAAKKHTVISNQRYEELKKYVDTLAHHAEQEV